MNSQEIFNKVATHLLTQGERSTTPNSRRCLYRAPGGKSCAVGCLIPDILYVPSMEDKAVSHLEIAAVLECVGIAGDNDISLLVELQNMHDKYDVESWEPKLRSIAVGFKLDASILESVSCSR